MLAVRRILRVRGRIRFLIISIQIIKGIKILGVPIGTKWINIFLFVFIHPKIIRLIHKVNPNVKLNTK